MKRTSAPPARAARALLLSALGLFRVPISSFWCACVRCRVQLACSHIRCDGGRAHSLLSWRLPRAGGVELPARPLPRRSRLAGRMASSPEARAPPPSPGLSRAHRPHPPGGQLSRARATLHQHRTPRFALSAPSCAHAASPHMCPGRRPCCVPTAWSGEPAGDPMTTEAMTPVLIEP